MSSTPQRIGIATLVQVVILEPIALPDETAESLKFRIEVFRWASDRFTCQLWRRETYRLKPAFPAPGDHSGEEWDAETYVLETGLAWDTIEHASAEAVIDAVIKEIEQRFAVTIA